MVCAEDFDPTLKSGVMLSNVSQTFQILGIAHNHGANCGNLSFLALARPNIEPASSIRIVLLRWLGRFTQLENLVRPIVSSDCCSSSVALNPVRLASRYNRIPAASQLEYIKTCGSQRSRRTSQIMMRSSLGVKQDGTCSLSRSLTGRRRLARFGRNFLKYDNPPRREGSSEASVGIGIRSIASTFLGSGRSPDEEIK